MEELRKVLGLGRPRVISGRVMISTSWGKIAVGDMQASLRDQLVGIGTAASRPSHT